MTSDFLHNKSVLVTGGTGSFGQRYIKYLLEETGASRIVIFSRDELKQSEMAARIADPNDRVRFFIGDIRDRARLQRAFHGVNYVIHAAALKQVPALEYNPFEAVQTNIIGTQNVIEAAVDQGVERVVFLSSDKAANPINLYGATKLCAEKLVISGNAYGAGRTRFAAVRYGNVFGSRGSLLRIIQGRMESGKKVALTHEDMTRFWITLEQGVALVMRAFGTMHGGEIFIPKIPSMKVIDFIKVAAPDSEIEIIGIRPGEKMHEVLITREEARHTREYETHYVVLPQHEWLNISAQYQDGKPVSEDFVLASDTNSDWLDESRLRTLLNAV